MRESGLGVAGGSFVETKHSSEKQSPSQYNIIESGYCEDPVSEAQIDDVFKTIKHVKDRFFVDIYPFVENPVDIKAIVFYRDAIMHRKAYEGTLSDEDKRFILHRIMQSSEKTNILNGGWKFCFSRVLNKYIYSVYNQIETRNTFSHEDIIDYYEDLGGYIEWIGTVDKINSNEAEYTFSEMIVEAVKNKNVKFISEKWVEDKSDKESLGWFFYFDGLAFNDENGPCNPNLYANNTIWRRQCVTN
jgi:hypothetical protein